MRFPKDLAVGLGMLLLLPAGFAASFMLTKQPERQGSEREAAVETIRSAAIEGANAVMAEHPESGSASPSDDEIGIELDDLRAEIEHDRRMAAIDAAESRRAAEQSRDEIAAMRRETACELARARREAHEQREEIRRAKAERENRPYVRDLGRIDRTGC